MTVADTLHLTANPLDDVRVMFSFPFMVNAFRAGTIVAVVAAATGWFMVLRRQVFAGHTLALVGFPGAAVAAYAGVSLQLGYFGACAVAAVVIAAGPESRGGIDEQSAAVATVQAAALAAGFLFVSLRGGNLSGSTSLLFGTLFGVTAAQVAVLLAVGVGVIVVLAIASRPLLFASIDGNVAAARGVPTRALSLLFLLVLGLTAAAVNQITGSLLVFALLVLPPAAAQQLTVRPGLSMLTSIAIAVLVTWFGLSAAFFSPYPSGFWITSAAFAVYVVASVVRRS